MLFLFLDGVGLGEDDPKRNPFAAADMLNLVDLLEGRRLVQGSAPFEGKRATLLAVDARLGVEGTPQSATGQAALLTGENVPAQVGEHYGPKPILRSQKSLSVTIYSCRYWSAAAPPRY